MNRHNRVILVYSDHRGGDVFSGANLPVGLGYVAKALETVGVEYEVIDLNVDPIDELIYKIGEFCPQFIGISMRSYRCKGTYKLLGDVKSAFAKVKIIVGGPHITANRERVMMECSGIDIGVVGEGEAVKFAGERDFIYNLNEIPFPIYRGLKLERYGKSMQLASSRDCPYKCIFCGASWFLPLLCKLNLLVKT